MKLSDITLTTVLFVAALIYLAFVPTGMNGIIAGILATVRCVEMLMAGLANDKVLSQLEEVKELLTESKSAVADVERKIKIREQDFTDKLDKRIDMFAVGANMFITNLNAITYKLGMGQALKQVNSEQFGGKKEDE